MTNGCHSKIKKSSVWPSQRRSCCWRSSNCEPPVSLVWCGSCGLIVVEPQQVVNQIFMRSLSHCGFSPSLALYFEHSRLANPLERKWAAPLNRQSRARDEIPNVASHTRKKCILHALVLLCARSSAGCFLRAVERFISEAPLHARLLFCCALHEHIILRHRKMERAVFMREAQKPL